MTSTGFLGLLGLALVGCGASDLSLGRGTDDRAPIADSSVDQKVDGAASSDAADAGVAQDSATSQPVPVSFVIRNIGTTQKVTLLRDIDLNISFTEAGKSQDTYVNPWFYKCVFICNPVECAGYTDVTSDATDIAPGQELRVTWDGVDWAPANPGAQVECDFKRVPPRGNYHLHLNERCGDTTFCPRTVDFTVPPSGDVVFETLSYPDHR